jgi:A/G-specific adenine glycosylase
MDLGATICRPKAPLCERCPVAQSCAALAGGSPESYPRRSAKADRPRRHGAAFLLMNGERIALVRRPPRGLLGGMLALPTSDWRATPWTPAEVRAAAPAAGPWRQVGEIEHVFTHFALTLQVWRAEGASGEGDLIWSTRDDLGGMPSVFLKAARAGLTPFG